MLQNIGEMRLDCLLTEMTGPGKFLWRRACREMAGLMMDLADSAA